MFEHGQPRREIEQMFRAVLEQHGPVRLLRLRWDRQFSSHRIELRGEWVDETAEVVSRQRIQFSASVDVYSPYCELPVQRMPDGRSGELDYQWLWSRMAEDFRMQQAAREQDEALHVLTMAAPDLPTFDTIREQVRTMRQHVERHHALPARFFVDGPEVYATARSVQRHAQEAQERISREMAQRFDRMAMSLLQGQTSSTVADAGQTTITLESVRRALETLSRNGMPQYGVDFGREDAHHVWRMWGGPAGGGFGGDVGTKEAREKGKKLLMDHLTADQRQEYEKTKAFTVTAPSGNKYRIREGRQMNIDVLDETGQRKSGICFLPEGQLVAGDCMLAQKIAIETCEELALSVANKFG